VNAGVGHEEGTLAVGDGLVLFHQSWTPIGPVRAAVIVVHGLGEHSGRYAGVVDRLVGRGCAVHAMDHRGHGRSEGARCDVERFDDFVDDLERFRRLVRERHPSAPLVVLGHSMGGAVVLAHAVRHPGAADALALSAPASGGGPRTAWWRVAQLRLQARLRPRSRATGLEPGAVTRDAAEAAAYAADPLVHHGPVPIRIRSESRAAARALPRRVGAITAPVLLLHGEADLLVPALASRVLAGRLGSRSITLRTYPGLYHEVFHEPERERVLDDLVDWMERFLGGSLDG
jgi:lysophospholipase